MKLFSYKKKTFVLGMNWFLPKDEGKIQKEDIVSWEKESKSDLGLQIRARYDQSYNERFLVVRSGVGLLNNKNYEDEEITSKGRNYYSLAYTLATIYPNAIFAFDLDDGSSDSWWMCVTVRGVPYTSTDVYGTRDKIEQEIKSIIAILPHAYKSDLIPKVVSQSESMASKIESFYLQSIDLKDEALKPIEIINKSLSDILDNNTPGYRKLGKASSLDRQAIYIAVFALIIMFSGYQFYDANFNRPEVTTPVTSNQPPSLADKMNFLKSKAKAQEEAAAKKASQKEFLQRTLEANYAKNLNQILTKSKIDWVKRAEALFYRIPTYSNGYELKNMSCDTSGKCRVVYKKGDYGFGNSKGLENALKEFDRSSRFINEDLSTDSASKDIYLDMKPYFRKYSYEDRASLPVSYYYVNELIERLNLAESKRFIGAWKMTKPKQLKILSDSPGIDFKGKLNSAIMVTGGFQLSSENLAYFDKVLTQIFKQDSFIGIRSIQFDKASDHFTFSLGATYVSSIK